MHDPFKTYLPWFILREIPSIGNTLYKRLIDHFGSADSVLNAPDAQLKKIEKIGSKTVKAISNHPQYHDQAKKELDLVLNSHLRILTLTDPQYPALLSRIPDPPPILTYLGSLDNQSPCISIVGSRRATTYGLNSARNLAARLANKGFQVVSGLALGIDTMAHQGALDTGNRTIAVLGSGLNKIYPRQNRKLFSLIARTGTVFSEFKINADPVPTNFPIRNRIIAGLSCGTLVVEAAKKSGSLITARLAGEYNREVFAVPGSIASNTSQGTHSLLKQGAKLVENELDIIDELGQFVHEKKNMPSQQENALSNHADHPPAFHHDSRHIIHFLDPYPVHIDSLIKKSRLDSSTVSSQLLDLELSGRVTRHQGNYYSIPEEYH
jgi:DNA processing protein